MAIGVCAHLGDRDIVCSTHRGHGHCIAKGVDVRGMMAELFGRRTGICKGKGGSMHIADIDKGMLGANGIVGAGIPLATGAALTAKLKKTGGVARRLLRRRREQPGPVPRVAQHGVELEAARRLRGREQRLRRVHADRVRGPSSKDIAERAKSYGMRGVIADGMDFFDVYEKAGEAIERARRGRGPDAARVQDLPLLRPLRRRPERLPPQGGDRGLEAEPRPPRPASRAASSRRGSCRATTCGASTARSPRRSRPPWREAEAAPVPQPEDVLTDVYVSE